MHTGFDHLLFDFRYGEREAIERGIRLFEPAFFGCNSSAFAPPTKIKLEWFGGPSLGWRVPDRFTCFEMRVINGSRCVYDQAFPDAVGKHA